MTNPEEELPVVPLQILENLGAIIESLQPEILQTLGAVAAHGATESNLEWRNRLADAADTIGNLLTDVCNALNDLPTDIVTDEHVEVVRPTETTPTPVLNHIDQQILAIASANESFRMVELRATIPELEAMSAEDFKLFRLAFPEKRQALLEQLAIQGTQAHWEITGQKKGTQYRLIIDSGTIELPATEPTTPKNTESSSASIRELVADKSQSESTETNGIAAMAVEFLRTAHGQQSFKHIVAAAYGKSHLSRQEERDFIRLLDSYVQAGKLHRYGKSFSYNRRATTRVETTPIEPNTLSELPPQPAIVLETQIDTAQPASINERLEVLKLGPIGDDVVRYALSHAFFGIEELRKNVPSVANLSSGEYVTFRLVFTNLRAKVEARLRRGGVAVHWDEAGKARGKKYQLIIDNVDGNPAAAPRTIQKPPVIQPIRQAERQDRYRFIRPEKPLVKTTLQQQAEHSLQTEQDQVAFITSLLSDTESHKQTVTFIAHELERELSINNNEARELIRQLVGKEHFYYNGSERGRRLLSLSQPEDNAGQSENCSDKDTNLQKDNPKAWTDIDVLNADNVFTALLELQHVQQGITVRRLMRDIGIDPSKEEQFRQSVRRLEAKGCIWIDTKANPNTRSNNSKRIQLPLVKLVNQKFKDRLKHERAAVIQELRDQVEVSLLSDSVIGE